MGFTLLARALQDNRLGTIIGVIIHRDLRSRLARGGGLNVTVKMHQLLQQDTRAGMPPLLKSRLLGDALAGAIVGTTPAVLTYGGRTSACSAEDEG